VQIDCDGTRIGLRHPVQNQVFGASKGLLGDTGTQAIDAMLKGADWLETCAKSGFDSFNRDLRGLTEQACLRAPVHHPTISTALANNRADRRSDSAVPVPMRASFGGTNRPVPVGTVWGIAPAIESSILQLIGSNLVGQAEAATFLLEVKHDAAAVLRQLHERQAKLIPTVAAA
jgi:hypothetical protein